MRIKFLLFFVSVSHQLLLYFRGHFAVKRITNKKLDKAYKQFTPQTEREGERDRERESAKKNN